jgi:hypothetical protein
LIKLKKSLEIIMEAPLGGFNFINIVSSPTFLILLKNHEEGMSKYVHPYPSTPT